MCAPSDTAMGPVSEAGDYVYDKPLILGSERTGPDLSYVGRKRSTAWEVDHMKDPRKYSPLSIMPSYEFLADEDLEAIATYLFSLGDRVAAERMITPPPEYAGLTDPLPYPLLTPTAGANPAPQGWASWLAADMQEGKEIYVSHCMTCHGAAGNGLGTYAGTLIVTPANYKQEPFRDMPDDQWFWHVSEGVPGTVMPPWKQSLSVEQRWKVIRYIKQIFARPIMRDPDEGDPSGDYAGLTNPLKLSIGLLEDAKHIFTRECSVCHGYSGTGNGIFADGLAAAAARFQRRKLRDAGKAKLSRRRLFLAHQRGSSMGGDAGMEEPLFCRGSLEAGPLHPQSVHPDRGTAGQASRW